MIKRIGDYNIGFTYFKDNKLITDDETIDKIKSLKIAPAYRDVIILNNKKILAYGYDSKGRKQVIYNPEFIKKQTNIKYKKILNLNNIFLQIRDDIDININNKDNNIRELSIIIYLIIYCGFRIGNKKYLKDNNSHGISTIQFKHISFNNVKIDNNKKEVMVIDFIGKKGIQNISTTDNKHIIKYLKNKKINKDDDDFVFDISSLDVNTYLKQFNNKLTTKDLRTWNANYLFIKYAGEYINDKKPVKKAIDKVAEKLHNTSTICKKNYINPYIIEIIENKIKNDNI